MEVLKESFRRMGIAYLCVWLMALISGAYSIWLFRCIDPGQDIVEQGKSILIWKTVVFLVSFGIVVYGLLASLRFSKQLKVSNLSGGIFFVGSALCLLLSTVLSLQSIPGINLGLSFLTNDTVKEVFSNLSFVGILCLVAILLFMAAPVLYFIGVNHLIHGEKDRFPALRGFTHLQRASLILMITVIVFSPFLIGYVACNSQEYENPTVFNTISGIIYVCSVAYFLYSWFSHTKIEIVPAEEVVRPTYAELPSSLREGLRQVGKNYLSIWVTILVSLGLMIGFFLSWSPIMAILTLIPFIYSWYLIVIGLRNTMTLHELLIRIKLPIGKYFIVAFIVLGVVSVLSMNTAFGGNVCMQRLIAWDEIGDILTSIPDFRSLSYLLCYIGFLALLLFIAFPVVALIGTIKLSSIIPAFKKGVIGASVLTFASVVFAPVRLLIFADDDVDNLYLYLFLAFICYGVGIFFFVQPWLKCNTIVDKYSAAVDGDLKTEPSFLSDGLKSLIGEVRKERRLFTTAIIGIVSVIISIISVVNFIMPKTTGGIESSTIDDDALDKAYAEVERAVRNQYDNQGIDYGKTADEEEEVSEVAEEIIEGPVHPDGYEEAIEEMENIIMLEDLYNSLVLVMDNPNFKSLSEREESQFIKDHFSPAVIKRLRELNDYDDGSLAFEVLRSGNQDGDGSSKFLNAESLGNNWYRVSFIDMGTRGTKDFLIEGGKIVRYR